MFARIDGILAASHYQLSRITPLTAHTARTSSHSTYPAMTLKAYQHSPDTYQNLQELEHRLQSLACTPHAFERHVLEGQQVHLCERLEQVQQAGVADRYLRKSCLVAVLLDRLGMGLRNRGYRSRLRKDYVFDLYQAGERLAYQEYKAILLEVLAGGVERDGEVFGRQGSWYRVRSWRELVEMAGSALELACLCGWGQFLGADKGEHELCCGQYLKSLVMIRDFKFDGEYELQIGQGEFYKLKKNKGSTRPTILFTDSTKACLMQFIQLLCESYKYNSLAQQRSKEGIFLELRNDKNEVLLITHVSRVWQPVSKIIPKLIKEKPGLFRHMGLSRMEVGVETVKRLGLAMQLTSLDISFVMGCPLQQLGECLAKLPPTLKDLNIAGLAINKQFLQSLQAKGSLKQISRLDLSHNLLSSEQLSHVMSDELICLRGCGLNNKTQAIRVQLGRIIQADRLTLSGRLGTLVLDCYMQLEDLNVLAGLPLQELTVRLVQERRFFRNQARQFADKLNKRLLKVDFSHSQVKIKHLKHILGMALQQLKLNFCSRAGEQCQPISTTIDTVYIDQLNMPLKAIRNLLGGQNMQHFKYVSYHNSAMSKQQFLTLVSSFRFKVIDNLQITESQFHHELIGVNRNHVAVQKYNIVLPRLNSLSHKFLVFFFNKKPINFITNKKDQAFIEQKLLKKAKKLNISSTWITVNNHYLLLQPPQPKVPCLDSPSTSKNLYLAHSKLQDSDLHVLLHHAKQHLKAPIYEINIQNCRELSENCIGLIGAYCPELQTLNCLDCSFTVDQVQEKLMALPELKQLNRGKLKLTWRANNPAALQKSLAFMLRSRMISELDLTIECEDEEVLVFQLLTIIVQTNSLIDRLKITIKNPSFLNSLSELLWDALSQHDLKNLSISIIEGVSLRGRDLANIFRLVCSRQKFALRVVETELRHYQEVNFQGVEHGQLKSLKLQFDNCWWAKLYTKDLQKQHRMIPSLAHYTLHLPLQDPPIQLLKSLPALKSLSLSLPACTPDHLAVILAFVKEHHVIEIKLRIDTVVGGGTEGFGKELSQAVLRNGGVGLGLWIGGVTMNWDGDKGFIKEFVVCSQ